MKKVVSILCLLFTGCVANDSVEKYFSIKLLRFNSLQNTILIDRKGIDSEVKNLIVGKDTITIEYGEHVYTLYEDLPTIISQKDKKELESLSGERIEKDYLIISNNDIKKEENYGLFLKNSYMYDTINGLEAIVVQPKRLSIGITGVYIPRLKDGNSFSMFGTNLDSAAHTKVMQIIKSIRYR